MNYLPGILIIILISSVIGYGFHLWKGGSIFRMIFIVVFSLIGFGIGQWIGSAMNASFLRVGWVQVGLGSIFSFIFGFGSLWLSKIDWDKLG